MSIPVDREHAAGAGKQRTRNSELTDRAAAEHRDRVATRYPGQFATEVARRNYVRQQACTDDSIWESTYDLIIP